MKRLYLVFVAMLLLGLVGAGCGDRCKLRELTDCSTNLSSCQTTCGSNSPCLEQCKKNYCDCLDGAGCDKGDECK